MKLYASPTSAIDLSDLPTCIGDTGAWSRTVHSYQYSTVWAAAGEDVVGSECSSFTAFDLNKPPFRL